MNIAICDDNKIFLEELSRKISIIVQDIGLKINVDAFSNEFELLDKAICNKYDIIILDIDMPNINGKELAKMLRKTNENDFSLIFISDYSSEVFNTFSLEIDSFIPKHDLSKYLGDELRRVIDRTQHKSNCAINKLFTIKENDISEDILIDLNKIIYVEVIKKSVYIHTGEETYKLKNKTFTELKDELCKFNFVDVHRTCIVNPRHVSTYTQKYVKMSNEEILPISRYKFENLRTAIKQRIVSEINNNG